MLKIDADGNESYREISIDLEIIKVDGVNSSVQ